MPFITYVRQSIIFSLIIMSCSSLADENVSVKEYDCVIVPSNVADLGSNARGIIDRMVVDRNDFVRRGDAIAVLNDKVERAVFELASKQATSTSEIELRKELLEHAQREQKRAEDAFNGKAYSAQAVDQAKSEAQQAKIRFLQAKEDQELAQKELDRAQAILALRTIRAPFSGVVTERFKSAGEYIESEPVVRLAKLDPLHVEVIVPASQQGKIKKGTQANVHLEEKSWTATVSQVDRVMDAASGTFGVRLKLPNPDYKITAGLRCRLDFFDAPVLQPVKEIVKSQRPSVHQPRVDDKDKTMQKGAKKASERGCERLGPYSGLTEANRVLGSQCVKDPSATIKQVKWMKTVGYRVVSDIFRTTDEKNDFVAALEAAGVTEYFALHQSDGVERISMGAFGKEDAARSYQKVLADKGVTTHLSPWRREVSHYWVKRGCEGDHE